MEREGRTPSSWAAVSGRWDFGEDVVTYLGPADQKNPLSHGVALCNIGLRRGTMTATVRFPEGAKDSTGEIAFGYDTGTQEYFAAGFGGWGYCYDITEFRRNHGWKAIAVAGTNENIVENRDYGVEVRVSGQEVRLLVDRIRVLKHNLPRPLMGDQVGYYAWGAGPVEFRSMLVDKARPKAFVVMQFGEPYDAI